MLRYVARRLVVMFATLFVIVSCNLLYKQGAAGDALRRRQADSPVQGGTL